MSEYIIKNGKVYDPKTGLKGDVADVCIKDGKIADKVSNKAKVIDAKGKTVMAGAVEVHAHVAGPKVNEGRNYRPEDKLFTYKPTGKNTRMSGGFSIPTTFKTGYEYARMGYTTVMEAAMPPLYARHVHEEIKDTPIIDEGAFPVFGNNWFVFEYLKNNEMDNVCAYISWLLKTTKGYAIKIVNPGGSEAWGWGENCTTVNDPVPYFDITPAEIVKGLLTANEKMGLPHSIHIHSNNLGNPGNYTTTLDTLKIAEGVKPNNKFGREQVLHHTHVQFHSYKGDSWANFESGAKEIADYFNKNKNMTMDLGCVTLDETTTMTADGPFEHHLTSLNHLKWANVDVELETSSGIVPYVYDPNIKVCAIQWAIGLELGLLAKDPMRTFITTDHPNAGPFTRYPRIMKWLMSDKSRQAMLKGFKNSDKVIAATNLASIDRELTLYEIAQMTRAGPAKSLGLYDTFGGLAPGMDADVVVYDLNEDKIKDAEEIEKAFSAADYVFKSGTLVVENGEVINNGNKRTLWVDAKVPMNEQVERDVQMKFLKFYSMNLNNYEVSNHYVPNPYVIEVDSN
ncbi:formylmethanofuran dehydrogenase, subunit A [Methanospirillum hungatei JF-1]|jgi:formylmethanofuran dehydrogenase subunit A|uniref:Formylmethanofuran dehydrogenase, subunit A n=1 Tax=Methanospirillum hungatei JF-1 (strain ATCC 27890 / DSM 864 / NBRC 100397 / JF-1) TaxID=323259 RepID=Q2FRC9_METHJ|nr:formylmethanofuran dehydrogenase subunit A [Methanospirillum hungatei]ABD41692.1 formylmethanofuran dehydrogenase, subunit A [Methanospirillum hungatei JF-1]MCA1916659.1 formylmethanofuran dehydrogenase subunit A [Methanospirillum hungatei]HOW03966.1 formylmethanofuran dehydrogenase subunit A [Methanospirillum hungatei]